VLLQRIVEHFAAAAFTVDHTRAADAVRMVVPACIAAVADVIMRSEATDIASEACLHLRKFAISPAALARQAATVPACTPELSLAREGALDYFASLDRLPKIFEWQRTERLDASTAAYLTAISTDVAFPTDTTRLFSYMTDPSALIMKNYPEFRCYRDICFYQKLFLNPDLRRFPSKNAFSQRDAQLTFTVEPPPTPKGSPTFGVKAFGDMALLCRPRVKRGEMPPTHRLPPLSSPSEYTLPYFVETEDDVLHVRLRPTPRPSHPVAAL